MYYVSKRLEIAASHRLHLPYDSPCTRLHGHNYVCTIHCKCEELDENGMVIDFKHIKEKVHDVLDHQCLNDLFPFNPTAENLARWICEQVPHCYKVSVYESESNNAIYEVDAD